METQSVRILFLDFDFKTTATYKPFALENFLSIKALKVTVSS